MKANTTAQFQHSVPQNVIQFPISGGSEELATVAEASKKRSPHTVSKSPPQPINVVEFPNHRHEYSDLFALWHKSSGHLHQALSKEAILKFGWNCISGEGDVREWLVIGERKIRSLSRFLADNRGPVTTTDLPR